MMAWVELAYSKSQVKRAGKVLRDSVRHPLTIDEQTVRDAELALENWRSAHAFALNSVQMTLRRQVERAQLTADVSQRLKERRTIIDKLLREPTMQLSTMQDIAGCRAVVPDLADVRQVVDGWHEARLRKLEIVEEYDYLEVSRPSGYRAYHLIVRHGEQGRLVEVQLRSQLQHAWAVAVESVGRTRGQSLKTGQGTPELLARFHRVAVYLAAVELGQPIDASLRSEAHDFLTMLQAGPTAPEGDHDD
jgi:ppGpp synthetase/RelA/SpoT-type nucleotidyltranferase